MKPDTKPNRSRRAKPIARPVGRQPPASRPFVLLNMAMSADGKIATTNRRVASFGSRSDHEHLLELRATADAVMAGARTVDTARINLGPGGTKFQQRRIQRGLAEFNIRVIVSGSGSINPRAEVFQHRFSPIIILTTQRTSATKLRQLRKVADEVKVFGRTEINFPRALRWLQARWKTRRIVCEGGGELNQALLRAGLGDELHLTVCPKIFGGSSAPTIADGAGGLSLAAATRFALKSARRLKDEFFLVYERRRADRSRAHRRKAR